MEGCSCLAGPALHTLPRNNPPERPLGPQSPASSAEGPSPAAATTVHTVAISGLSLVPSA